MLYFSTYELNNKLINSCPLTLTFATQNPSPITRFPTQLSRREL
jgi:hypothetical protein